MLAFLRSLSSQAARHLVAPGSVLPYAITTLVSALLSIATIIVFTRLLSPASYGLYAVVASAATLMQAGFFHWLQAVIVRFQARKDDKVEHARLRQALQLGYVVAAGAASLVWAAATLVIEPSDLALAAAGLLMLLSRAWVGMVQSWNRTTGRQWRFVATEAVSAAGTLFLALAGLWLRPGNPAVPLLAAVLAALLAAALSPELARVRRLPRWRLWRRLSDFWVYGAPLSLVSLVSVVLALSDRLLIAVLLGPAAAGAYSVASAIAERAIGLPLLSVALATKPLVFAEFERHGAAATRDLLARVAAWLMAAGLPAATLIVFAPGAVTSILVGSGMATAAAVLLPWLAAAGLLSGVTALHFALAFQIARRTRGMLLAVLPAAALNVAANLVLLPRYGAIAAAWTALGSAVLALVLVRWLAKRHFTVPFPAGDFVRTALACAPVAVFLRAIPADTASEAVLLLAGAVLLYGAFAVVLDVAGFRRAVLRT